MNDIYRQSSNKKPPSKNTSSNKETEKARQILKAPPVNPRVYLGVAKGQSLLQSETNLLCNLKILM